MTIFTYWGNLDERRDATSVLEVAAGFCPVGQSIDMTPAEYQSLSQHYDLRAGAIPWTRTNFPWPQQAGGPVSTSPPSAQGVTAWQANTAYLAGQQVAYSNQIYAAKANFTSGSSFNQSNWTLVGTLSPSVELTTNKGLANGYAALDQAAGVPLAELPLIAQSRGHLIAVREITSALPASQSAQSHPYDTQDPTTVGADGLAVFSAMMTADQSGTLVVQSSADGVTWNTEASVATAAVGSKQVARFSGIPSQRYVQAVETNGATPQTSNLLVTTLVALEAA